MSDHLLPSNATDFEKNVASGLSRISDIAVPIGDLWNADTCPLAMLPYLAWGLAVPVWDAGWSEKVQRNVCRTAVAVHRKRGTFGAIRDALESIGSTVDLVRWFDQTPAGAPGTFTAMVYVNETISNDQELLSAKRIKQIRAMINGAKALRSHYSLTVGVLLTQDICLAGAIEAAQATITHAAVGIDPPIVIGAIRLAGALSFHNSVQLSAEIS